MNPRRVVVAGSLGSMVTILLVAAAASASLDLILSVGSGSPGELVLARTGGRGAFATTNTSYPTYLVPTEEHVDDPRDPSALALGAMVVDGSGNGWLAFEVPRVSPGDYVVMVHCPPCAPTSAGRSMLVVAEFRVTTPGSDPRPWGTFDGLLSAVRWVVAPVSFLVMLAMAGLL